MQLEQRLIQRLPIRYREPGAWPFWVRIWLGRIVGLLAFFVITYYAYQVRPRGQGEIYDYDYLVDQLRYAVLGVQLLLLTLLVYYPQKILHWHTYPNRLNRNVNVLAGVAGGLGMMAFIESQTMHLGISALEEISPDDQFRIFVPSILLLSYGLGGGGLPWRAGRILRRLKRLDWAELAALSIITMIGFLLRYWDVSDALHIFVDELNFATVTASFWTDQHRALTEPGVMSFPFMFPYVQNHFVTLFGRNLDGLRMASVVMGAGTVPAVYLLARALFDRPTALAAALIIATFPPHLQYSRLGLNNIADPFFGTFAFAFMARAFRHNRRIDFVLAGVTLGLTQYWYEVGRTLYPLIMALWCGWGLVVGYSRSRLRGMVLAALAALIVAAPIYATIYHNGLPLNARVQTVGNTDTALGLLENLEDDIYPERALMAYMVYVHQPEWGTLYIGGHNGFVLPGLIPFFLIGAAFAVLRITSPSILLAMLIITNNFFTSLIVSTQFSARYVAAFPMIAILIALGLRVIIEVLLSPHVVHRVLPAVLVVMVMFGSTVAFAQAFYYFDRQLDVFNIQFRANLDYDPQDAVFRISEYPPDYQGHIIATRVGPDHFLNGILGFLRDNPNNDGIQVHDRSFFLPFDLPADRPYVFYTPKNDQRMAALIGWYYAIAEPTHTPHNVPEGYQLVEYESFGRLQGPHAPYEMLRPTPLSWYFGEPRYERWMFCYDEEPPNYALQNCIRADDGTPVEE